MRKALFRLSFFLCFLFASTVTAQNRLAVVVPEKTQIAQKLAEVLQEKLLSSFRFTDSTLTETAFKAQNLSNPFNLSLQEARNLGNAIGCNFYFLLKADTIKRTRLDIGTYTETYAFLFFVSTKSGRLLFWKLIKAEDKDENKSIEKFLSFFNDLLTQIVTKIQSVVIYDLKMQDATQFPDFNEQAGVRPPVPYRRISPEYTDLARLYLISATIDVAVDLNEKGEVVRTEILRWAGFGLEEAVVKAIKTMNWRPAEKDGKAFSTRILLRYNFKEIKEK